MNYSLLIMSVYYWLDKHNFHGINDFKRMVLSDRSPLPTAWRLSKAVLSAILRGHRCFLGIPKKKTPLGSGVS